MEERYLGNKQTIKPLKDLTLLDRFLFAEVMDDPETNRLILEIILGKELRLHDWTQTEKEVRVSPLARSIRIDVFHRMKRVTCTIQKSRNGMKEICPDAAVCIRA